MHIHKLSNGVAVLLEEMPHLESASIGAWIKTGSSNETVDTNGLSHFMEHLFFKGTRTRTARQLMETVESRGGSMNASTGRDWTSVYVRILADHVPLALELLGDVLKNSLAFQETPVRDIDADIEREKSVVIEEIAEIYDSPEEYVHDLFFQQLWPDHPTGFPITGSADVIRGATRDDIRGFYRQRYRSEKIVITAAGKFSADEVMELVSDQFSEFPSGQADPGPSEPAIRAETRCHYREIGQAQLYLGMPTLTASDPRRFPLTVMAQMLGGTASSRLFQKVREEQGLAYTIGAYSMLLANTGALCVYAATSPDRLNRTIDLVFDELRDIRDNHVPDDELRNTKEQIKGSMVLALETTSARMARIAASYIYRGTVEPVEEVLRQFDAVTGDNVKALAEEFITDDKVSLTCLGPVREVDRPAL